MYVKCIPPYYTPLLYSKNGVKDYTYILYFCLLWRFLRVPTINVLSIIIKTIRFFSIFTAEKKNHCILHGRVIEIKPLKIDSEMKLRAYFTFDNYHKEQLINNSLVTSRTQSYRQTLILARM